MRVFLEAEAANSDSKGTHCRWLDNMLMSPVWRAVGGEQSWAADLQAQPCLRVELNCRGEVQDHEGHIDKSQGPGPDGQTDGWRGDNSTRLYHCWGPDWPETTGQLGVLWKFFSTHQVVRFQRTEKQGQLWGPGKESMRKKVCLTHWQSQESSGQNCPQRHLCLPKDTLSRTVANPGLRSATLVYHLQSPVLLSQSST